MDGTVRVPAVSMAIHWEVSNGKVLPGSPRVYPGGFLRSATNDQTTSVSKDIVLVRGSVSSALPFLSCYRNR